MADYKQLYEQVCEQYDILAKELEAIKQALAAPVQEPVGYITQARCFVHLHECTEAEAKLYGWKALYTTPPAAPVQEPVLQDIEQYRLQMAGISTAAIGYWKESDGIHPDYDTPALRDVAKLYAKYDALYTAAQPATEESSATQPAQPAPVPLTDEQITAISKQVAEGGPEDSIDRFVRAIEAHHGITKGQP
jgi:hypothetical protein